MRVGVTGASGFIGSALVASLAARGDDVVSFTRPGATAPSGMSVRWDPGRGLVDDDDLRRVGPLDAVVHLAGAGLASRRWTAARKAEILESRTRSTHALVNALLNAPFPVPFLASASAVGYYGSRGDEVLDEASSPGQGFLARVCLEWERAANELADRATGVATLRTGIVAGSHGGALARQLVLFRLGLGGRLGSGRQWLSPISLHDATRAILFVIDNRLTGAVNLVAPCALTNRDFTAALARAVHRPAVIPVPEFALRLALGSELARDAALASQRVQPGVLARSGFDFHHADIDALLAWALTTVD